VPPRGNEKAQHIHRLFNSVAPRYDLMNDLMTLGLHRRWRAHAVKLAGTLEPGGWGLDLCCGSGDFLALLLDITGGKGHFIGMDFSEEMLALARRRFSRQVAGGTVELILGDVRDLSSLPAREFSMVTCGFGLRNVAEPSRVLEQAGERLRPDGAFVSLDLTRPAPLLLQPAVALYMRWLIPLLARIVAGAGPQYLWLHESRQSFPTRDELAELMRMLGYRRVRIVNYGCGVVAAHIGYRRGI